MAAGRVVAALSAVVAAVAVAPVLLAGVTRADCFDYCFKNCIANDKSMTDYCNYACDKTCEPGAPQRPLLAATGGDMGCQLSCARTSCDRLRPGSKAMETCFGQCYDGCKTKALPRPLRAGAGVPTALGSVPRFPALEPDPDDAASEKHPFHEKQDNVRPASEPDPDDALLPGSDPDKDDTVRPSSNPKDGAVRPSSQAPDPDGAVHQRPASSLDSYSHEKQDGVQPASEQDKDDSLRPAWGPALLSSEIHAAPPATV